MNSKVYVDVMAEFTRDGQLIPKKIVWEDGHIFDIDRIKDVRRAASLRAGGCGMRYTCQIDNCEAYLYYEEDNKWFVVRK